MVALRSWRWGAVYLHNTPRWLKPAEAGQAETALYDHYSRKKEAAVLSGSHRAPAPSSTPFDLPALMARAVAEIAVGPG